MLLPIFTNMESLLVLVPVDPPPPEPPLLQEKLRDKRVTKTAERNRNMIGFIALD
jgi:hypothetical protein